MRVGPYIIAYTKIESKWMDDPKIRTKTVKLLEENMGETSKTLDMAMIL